MGSSTPRAGNRPVSGSPLLGDANGWSPDRFHLREVEPDHRHRLVVVAPAAGPSHTVGIAVLRVVDEVDQRVRVPLRDGEGGVPVGGYAVAVDAGGYAVGHDENRVEVVAAPSGPHGVGCRFGYGFGDPVAARPVALGPFQVGRGELVVQGATLVADDVAQAFVAYLA